MDIPKVLEDSVCAAIVRMDNGWGLVMGDDVPDLAGFTVSNGEADKDNKESYKAAVDLLYTILEHVLWMPNSKHNPYRIEIKIVNQLSTKEK